MAEEKKEQFVSELDLNQKNQLKRTLLNSSEGRCLLIGVALAFVFTLWLGIKLLLSPEDSQVLIGITATQIMFGRAASIAFGCNDGTSDIVVHYNNCGTFTTQNT